MRRVLSFPSLAYKVGAVSLEQLRAAHAVSQRTGLSMEAVLMRSELSPELVSFVRDAQYRAQVSCEVCGGRTDLRPGDRREYVCRCSTLRHVA